MTKLQRGDEGILREQMLSVYNVDMDTLSWEEFITIWGRLNEVEDSVKWGQALLCAAVEVRYGEGSIKAFAADIGIGESTAYRLRRTWLAFPRPDDRWPELSFFHHELAASTNDPAYWAEYAALHGLSTYGLQRAISKRAQQTKVELAKETRRALTSGEPVRVEEIELPANHQVPLSSPAPATFRETRLAPSEEELEKECVEFVCGLVEKGYLVSQIANIFKRVLASLEGQNNEFYTQSQ